ncbi:MAG: N-acetylneuraminate synthase [Rickettsiales bacterium]|nr:N-acetylneuraminate synthase [Rickettsiales bacterium]
MSTSCYIIAEAGVNHDGDLQKAHLLVDIAADAGADAVKFQLFVPELLVTGQAPTATYQSKNLKDDAISQQAMLQKLTLPAEAMIELATYCQSKKIDFLCTPFEHQSLKILTERTKMRYLKLASGEVTNGPLLLASARTGLPIILSTGMSNLDEIGIALSILHFGYSHKAGSPQPLSQPTADMLAALKDKVTLLHCVSQYPAPIHLTNLKAMETIAKRFGLPIGLSDHTVGITMSVAAAARGASVIEKHFSYDVKATGPDHSASLSAGELKAMAAAIREVESGLGNGEKHCQAEERNTLSIARRSVVAAYPIEKGEKFSEQNLICKRPATGPVSPNQYWQLLGKPAKSGYAADDFIQADELKD